MKRVLFVINTLGGAGAEKALLELLKRFTPDRYEVDLYVLLEQGELISQVPGYVNILNRDYTAESVLSAEGKKELNRKVLRRLFIHRALLKNIPYLIKNTFSMLGRKKIYPDKFLWRIMSDSGMKLNKSYDMAVAYLEGGATYFVHDHVKAKKKFTFLHVDYKYAGYSRGLDRDCYLDFDRIFTVSGEVKSVFDSVYPESQSGANGLALEAGVKGKNLTEWQYGIASRYPRWNVSGTYMQALPVVMSAAEDGTDEREFLLPFFSTREDMMSAIFLKGYQWPFDTDRIWNGSSVIDLLVYQETVLFGRRVYLDFRRNTGNEEIQGMKKSASRSFQRKRMII